MSRIAHVGYAIGVAINVGAVLYALATGSFTLAGVNAAIVAGMLLALDRVNRLNGIAAIELRAARAQLAFAEEMLAKVKQAQGVSIEMQVEADGATKH
jgi:hypothetical protein